MYRRIRGLPHDFSSQEKSHGTVRLTRLASPSSAAGSPAHSSSTGWSPRGDVSDLSDRFIDQARKVVKFLGVPRAFAIKITREGFHGKSGSQNVLAQVVMHFASDPALLSFRGIEKGVFQEFTFGHLSSEAAVHRWMTTNMPKRLRKWFDPASFGRHLKARSRRMTRNLQRLIKPRQGRAAIFCPDDFGRFPTKDQLCRAVPK